MQDEPTLEFVMCTVCPNFSTLNKCEFRGLIPGGMLHFSTSSVASSFSKTNLILFTFAPFIFSFLKALFCFLRSTSL